MNDNNIWAARRAASAQYGNRFLDEPAAQKTLRFEKHQDIIFDSANARNLAYYFPSAVGTALFYYGHFELGEIAFIARMLSDTPNPVILDVGANIGSHSLEWARRLESSVVYAFEPAPSNVSLLARNVKESEIVDRIVIVEKALGDAPGSATFFETDDAAYSALQDTMRRPVRSKYDVEVTTIDAFVQAENVRTVSLIKIDVEGTEDAVLAGAVQTIKQFKPLLFIEIYGGTNSNPDPERTIAMLVNLGYVPHVISDGIMTQYEKHDDNFYNYVFVPKSYSREMPAPDLRQKRLIDAERLELVDKLTVDLRGAGEDVLRAQARWEELDRAVQEKDASLHEKDREIRRLTASADALRMQLSTSNNDIADKDVEIKKLTASAGNLEQQLRLANAAVEAKDRKIQEVSESAQGLEKQLQAKDALIGELTSAANALRVQLDEKDALIMRLNGELEKNAEQVAAVFEELSLKEASIQPMYAEMETLRTAANERLAMITELNNVSEARLAVILTLNQELARLQTQ